MPIINKNLPLFPGLSIPDEPSSSSPDTFGILSFSTQAKGEFYAQTVMESSTLEDLNNGFIYPNLVESNGNFRSINLCREETLIIGFYQDLYNTMSQAIGSTYQVTIYVEYEIE